jgi:putative phosphonate metabolism protein
MAPERAMTTFRRFALFWAPPRGGALARFGASWLGWDIDAGELVPHLDVPQLPVSVAEITATPRRYGFHGTLKPPFRLRDGAGLAELDRAAAALAAAVAPFQAPPLAPARIGAFVALVPSAACAPLDDLAAACVRELDGFRAPPDERELARRRAHGLSPRQEEHLARWGYPYVLDEFRFHLTLTGALDREEAADVFATLAGLTAPFCAVPLPVAEICMCGEGETGHFRIIRRYALTG